MSCLLKQTYTETFEVIKVWVNFMSYKSYSKYRQDTPKCEICRTDFKEEDNTNLAFIKDKKNHLICDKCSDKAIKGGAERCER
ncbi:hypothetical protein [Bacillus cereus]|uniref:hypothetical protein n=1 Tax=Bacillus cereus TaxID=1396 RepID=UPI000BFEA853|nr:hypothetical protein [Bacillus cereus]PGT10234.1 hypothetical protein COD03_21025 [Bacillus cereus]